MNPTHWAFIQNATGQALALLQQKDIDREALRALLRNLHAFARDQAIITRPDGPRYLQSRLSKWRG